MAARFDNYSLQIWVANVTSIVGPLVGGSLPVRPALFVSGGFYLLAFVNLFFSLRDLSSGQENGSGAWGRGRRGGEDSPPVVDRLRGIEWRRAAGPFTEAFLMWFAYSQLYFVVSLFVGVGLGHQQAVGSLFSLNALTLVAFQFPVSKLVGRYVSGGPDSRIHCCLSMGFACVFVGYASLSLSWSNYLWSFASVVVLSLGELINMPLLDSSVSRLSDGVSDVVLFSVYSLFCGAGYGLSSLIFVWLSGYGFSLFFILLAAMSLLGQLVTWSLASNAERAGGGYVN